MKQRTSYLGKILSEVADAYSKEDIKALEDLINELNNDAVEKSDILSTIQETLKGVDSAIDNDSSKVAITPFAKKIRDLNKNISIQYGELDNSFTMDYHGMGTRSWSSLLTFKAFINQIVKNAENKAENISPIIAIEEPEAHLHPNAQKKLYSQIHEMPGQKIISTHSSYIAASADLNEIRGLYKKNNSIKCGVIDTKSLNDDEKRKIKQKVLNTRGEIFFSKALVFFEGETEEQALPILAEKYFGTPALSMGIDFIGVGGAGNYGHFLQFAEAMNIPWYIFSDGEDAPVKDMTDAVKKIRKTDFTDISAESNVFIIPAKEDFEKYIVGLNYLEDIKKYVKSIELPKCVNDSHRNRKEIEIDSIYTKEYVLIESKKNKTKWALIFANSIFNSLEVLPPLAGSLFDKIKNDMNNE